MACFFTTCPNFNLSHLLDHVHLDHHRGGILVPLSTVVLEDVEVLGLYGVIRLARYISVLCLLALPCSQEIDRPCCGGDDSPLLFDFSTR